VLLFLNGLGTGARRTASVIVYEAEVLSYPVKSAAIKGEGNVLAAPTWQRLE
jgi:hypothetical protein